MTQKPKVYASHVGGWIEIKIILLLSCNNVTMIINRPVVIPLMFLHNIILSLAIVNVINGLLSMYSR